MTRNNNNPPIVEERVIELETIQELREKITVLQNELAEEKRHAEKMDSLAWEMHETKSRLETKKEGLQEKINELGREKVTKDQELAKERKEKEKLQKEIKEKDKTIADLKEQISSLNSQLDNAKDNNPYQYQEDWDGYGGGGMQIFV